VVNFSSKHQMVTGTTKVIPGPEIQCWVHWDIYAYIFPWLYNL